MLFDNSYSSCRHVRSFITGKNKQAEVLDDDNGDIVVADLNFDGLEDIAIKSDDENAGTFYTFYVQGKDSTFRIDKYLTDSIRLFPMHIDKKSRTLTTDQRIGVGHIGEHVYKFDIHRNKWLYLSHRLIPPR